WRCDEGAEIGVGGTVLTEMVANALAADCHAFQLRHVGRNPRALPRGFDQALPLTNPERVEVFGTVSFRVWPDGVRSSPFYRPITRGLTPSAILCQAHTLWEAPMTSNSMKIAAALVAAAFLSAPPQPPATAQTKAPAKA